MSFQATGPGGESTDTPEATLRLLRAAGIPPVKSKLEDDLTLRSSKLLQVVENHWGAAVERHCDEPIDGEVMRKSLTKIALKILEEGEGEVPVSWARSRIIWRKKAERRLKAVAGGMGKMIGNRSEAGAAWQEVKNEIKVANSLPMGFLKAAEECGVLRILAVPEAPQLARVRFTHDALLYSFAALRSSKPGSLDSGLLGEHLLRDEHRLCLAKLDLLQSEHLAEGLDTVAERDLDTAAYFALRVPEARRLRGEAIVERYFGGISWGWPSEVEEAWEKVEPFGDLAAKVARERLADVLEPADSDEEPEGSIPTLAAAPLALMALERFGEPDDLALLQEADRKADGLGQPALDVLNAELAEAREGVADEETVRRKKMIHVGMKVGVGALAIGLGALTKSRMPPGVTRHIRSDFLDEQKRFHDQIRHLPRRIERLEKQLAEFRSRVKKGVAEAAEAIARRAA